MSPARPSRRSGLALWWVPVIVLAACRPSPSPPAQNRGAEGAPTNPSAGATPARAGATDPARAATDPARAGATPARAATDPARAGATPARAATDPARTGTDPARAATDPARAGVDPARAATDPARAATDPARAGALVRTAGAPLSAAAAKQELDAVARCLYQAVSLLQREPRLGELGTFFGDAHRRAVATPRRSAAAGGASASSGQMRPGAPAAAATGARTAATQARASWPLACRRFPRRRDGKQLALSDGTPVGFTRRQGSRDELAGGITRWFIDYRFQALGRTPPITSTTQIEHQVGGH